MTTQSYGACTPRKCLKFGSLKRHYPCPNGTRLSKWGVGVGGRCGKAWGERGQKGQTQAGGGEVVNGNPKTFHSLRPRIHGNVFLRFCIVSSNELVVLDSLENSKQYDFFFGDFLRNLLLEAVS